MTTAELSWGQIQQWTWINEMRRDPSRWVVVGDVLESGAESKVALERALGDLLTEYELDLWVMAGLDMGEALLRQSRFDVPVEWTSLRGSRVWAAHVIHSRFRLGRYAVDVCAKPIRLFGYTREDGRFSVIAAISHLFADGAGLKGLARVLSDRLGGRPERIPVAALSDVLSAQRAARRREGTQTAGASDRFEEYYRSFDWDRLVVREAGEIVFRPGEGEIGGGTGSMTFAGTVVAALGSAWRQCIDAADASVVPMTVLHRLPSPVAGRPYMGPGDLNVFLEAPSPGADLAEAGATIWRSLVGQSRQVLTVPPADVGTTRWTVEQARFRRTLRLNVRANASELAREPGADRFVVRSSRSEAGARAFADVAFTSRAFTVRWDIPRAAEAQGRDETFGQLTLAALRSAGRRKVA